MRVGKPLLAASVALGLTLATSASSQGVGSNETGNYLMRLIENYANSQILHGGEVTDPAHFIDDMKNYYNGIVSPQQSLMDLLRYFGILGEGAPMAGYFGNGGADGDLETCEVPFRLDAEGNLIVPSMPLKGGGPMMPGTTAYYSFTQPGNNQGMMADSSKAAILWQVHKGNIYARGNLYDSRAWYGVLSRTSSSFTARSVAYLTNSGQLVPAANMVNAFPQSVGWSGDGSLPGWLYRSTGYTNAKQCPQSMTGGEFDFYVEWHEAGWNDPGPKDTVCVMYAPNKAISPSGYYLNPQTTVPAGNISGFPNNTWMKGSNCRLKGSLLTALFNVMLDNACPDCPPVTTPPDELPPPVDDLGDPPPALPAEPTPPTPLPTSTPTPGATSGPMDPGPVPSVPLVDVDGTLPGLPTWFPDLPSFNMGENTVCPVYSATVWETQITVDTHCPLIEDNRATIAALMLVFFTVASLFIVLRA